MCIHPKKERAMQWSDWYRNKRRMSRNVIQMSRFTGIPRRVISPAAYLTPRPKLADKPGSVAGDHLSGTAVTRRLERPTQGSDGTGSPVPRRSGSCPCLALLPVGVAWPPVSPRTPVVSYTAFSPLPGW
jgi:hypothetical protein